MRWFWALQVPLVALVAGPALAQSNDTEGSVPRGGAGAVVRPAAPDDAGAAKPTDVVMPRQIHFEHAVYPPEAQAQGLEASVVLKLVIDREGNVVDAQVPEPVGRGFDEAAREAALKFKYEPATRAGKPIPVTILYKYEFTLAPASAADVPPPRPPDTGEFAGVLRISGGETPLAGTDVAITLPDGSLRHLTTDAEGKFSLKPAPAGHYRVAVRVESFLDLNQEEDIKAGEAVDVVYRVTPRPTGIEVLVEGERPQREVTRRTIERREIDRIPGTSGDALRSIQSLPGVARPPGLAGLLIIRGSSPQDTDTFIDGSLTPLIYHFGGLSSVVPTELLDRIDFYPGNFSAKFGRVQGGVVDVGLRAPDTHCDGDFGTRTDKNGCYHGLFQVDLIDTRAMVQGPIGASKEWSFALAGRRSWIDVWLKPVLTSAGAGVTTAPVYYDYQAIVERRHKKSRFSLRGFGSDDRLKVLIADPAAQDPGFGGTLSFGTGFYRLQALYRDELSRAVSLDSMLSIGKDAVDFSIGNLLFKIDAIPIYARSELTARVMQGVKFNAGIDFLTAPFDVVVRAPEPPRPGEPDPGPFVNRPLREVHTKSTVFRPGWYGEFELQPAARLRVIPGVRFDFARDSGHADFSPRINARYDLIPAPNPEELTQGVTRRRTSLKGGVGVFNQPPQFQETNSVFGTPNLLSNRSVHYSFGVEQELSTQIDLSVEGFYKDLTRQVSRAAASTGFAYDNAGLGSVVGLEALLKYKPDKNFFGWVAYTLSRSVRRDRPDAPERLFEYDQTHNLIILGSYRLGRGWEFGGRFRVVSGPLDTPVVSAPALASIYAADAGSYVPLQGKQFSHRLPLFHQLDLRVDKRWQFRHFRFSAYLDVQNAYSNAAVEGVSYNFDFTKQGYQTGIPIIPSLGMRGEF
jgi:TonB family protein